MKLPGLTVSLIVLSKHVSKCFFLEFSDMGEMWRRGYESENFIEDLDNLWMQVKPLYDELHRYTRKKLKERYGNEIDVSDGLIPAHVLGKSQLVCFLKLALS